MRSVAAATLGCKVNLYDTNSILSIFAEQGYEIREFDEIADIYIVNTCTVTNLGDKKSRQMLRRARQLNPEAVIVACGCYAQVNPDEIAAIPGIDIITGTKDRKSIISRVEAILGECTTERDSLSVTNPEYEEISPGTYETGRTRSFVKIQDGCENFCAYCVIPYARGAVKSRKPENILNELFTLSNNGCKEAVLAGINVSSYGKDFNTDLTSLLNIISENISRTEIKRMRFSSLEPNIVTPEFVTALTKLSQVCEHFHLSLQSGCDKTLAGMNRKYSSSMYKNAVNLLRDAYPDASFTTDVIVGFPGETAEDFIECREFIKEIGFLKLHVFPFSPKKGTAAYSYPFQVDKEEKLRRSKELLELSDVLGKIFIGNFVGRDMNVLFESEIDDGVFDGYTGNYIAVRARGENLSNTIKKCLITGRDGLSGVCEII